MVGWANILRMWILPRRSQPSHKPPAWWSQRFHRTGRAVTCSVCATIFLILSTSNLKPAKIWFLSREGQSACRWLYHLWPWRSSQIRALSGLPGWGFGWLLRDDSETGVEQGCLRGGKREEGGWVNGKYHMSDSLLLPASCFSSSFHSMMDGRWDKGSLLYTAQVY